MWLPTRILSLLKRYLPYPELDAVGESPFVPQKTPNYGDLGSLEQLTQAVIYEFANSIELTLR